MSKTANDVRLFLCTCSGEDGFIVKKCIKPIQISFASIGFFVLFIFFICFWSATLFTYNLFDAARWISVPFGIIWGLLIANIYLLLLHTISPKLLPVAKKINSNQTETIETKFLSSSMVLRLSFMLLLAIIISQPLNYYFFSKSVESTIQKHKDFLTAKMYYVSNQQNIEDEIQLFKDFNHLSKYTLNKSDSTILAISITTKIIQDANFNIQTKSLLSKLHKINTLKFISQKLEVKKESILIHLSTLLNDQLNSDNTFKDDIKIISISDIKFKPIFDKYKSCLIQKVNDRNNSYENFNQLIDSNNFYIKTIQILLHKNPLSWFITLLLCIVFLLPIYLKFTVRNLSKSYFDLDYKNNPEMKKVREEILNPRDFNWLERKIKAMNFNDFQTSDYYFKRMIIEHRIILEEYEKTKQIHSKLLTENVKIQNKNSLSKLLPLIEKLKKVNLEKYTEFKKGIDEEYKNQIISKHEYWIDPPFRTKKATLIEIKNTEIGLLDFVYNRNEEQENTQNF